MTRIGEVIRASTTGFTAQVLKSPDAGLDMPKAPAFGSFVRAELEEDGLAVYGLVYHVETTSLDAAHRPVAMNMSRQELREQQPQIFDLLRTDFAVLTTAHGEGGHVMPFLPPHPPQVHDFVHPCDADEVAALTASWGFLRAVLAFEGAPADELAAACVREAHARRGRDEAVLLAAARTLSGLLRHDYARLTGILERFRTSPAPP